MADNEYTGKVERVHGVPYFRFRYVTRAGAGHWCFDREPLEWMKQRDDAEQEGC